MKFWYCEEHHCFNSHSGFNPCRIVEKQFDAVGVLKRDVTVEECPWLNVPMRLGTHVYRYEGDTYGVTAARGVACSMDGNTPFFELPNDAVNWLGALVSIDWTQFAASETQTMKVTLCDFCSRSRWRHWVGWLLYPWTGEAHTWS